MVRRIAVLVVALAAVLVAPALAATKGYVQVGDEKVAKVTKDGSKYFVRNYPSGEERGYVKPASKGNSASVWVRGADGVTRKLGKVTKSSSKRFKLYLNGDRVGSAKKNGKVWDIYEGKEKRGYVRGLNPAASAGAGLLGLIVQIG